MLGDIPKGTAVVAALLGALLTFVLVARVVPAGVREVAGELDSVEGMAASSPLATSTTDLALMSVAAAAFQFLPLLLLVLTLPLIAGIGLSILRQGRL